MVTRTPADADPSRLLAVPDTQAGLEALAVAARARSAAKIVAVTGSVGKTGTKEALATVLGGQGATHASSGNLNNQIGMPLSLARMPAASRFGVFEIGMNHAGEIAPLSAMLRPHAAVVTTVEAFIWNISPTSPPSPTPKPRFSWGWTATAWRSSTVTIPGSTGWRCAPQSAVLDGSGASAVLPMQRRD